MKFSVALSLPLLLSLAAAAQGAQPRAAASTLRSLDSSIDWNAASAQVADFNCDGKPDTAILGTGKDKVAVGVVWGGSGKKPEIFVFPVGPDRQDGFCSRPSVIRAYQMDCDNSDGPLPGCKVVRGCQAFTVPDHNCDGFNFYWDSTQRALAWWRH